MKFLNHSLIFLLTFIFLNLPIHAKKSHDKALTKELSKDHYLDINSLNNIEVPSETTEQFTLFLPEENLMTLKPQLKIKGLNRLQSPVFVQDHFMDVRNDGRFYHNYQLETYGKNTLLFSFITPENQRFYMTKKVLYLYSPPDLKDFPNNRLSYIYLFNSPFLFDPEKNKQLKDPFTRADLAYFLKNVSSIKNNEVPSLSLNDISEDFWGLDAINFAITHELMTAFPDNTFKPDKAVSRLEYIISLVKALELNFSDADMTLPYDDVEQDHWTSKYIRASHENNLIPERGTLGLNRDMSVADFVRFSHYVTEVQLFIENLLNFDHGYQIHKDDFLLLDTSIQVSVDAYQEKLEALTKILVEKPQHNDIVLGTTVPFEGAIYPPKEFFVNGLKVVPDLLGKFSLVLPISSGKNEFSVDAFNKTNTMNVFSIVPYMDAQQHWVGKTAAQLRHLAILEPDLNLNPSKTVSREEFSHFIVKAFNLQPSENMSAQPLDVNISNMYFDSILTTMSLSILTENAQNKFNPKKTMSKAEVVTALIRVLSLFPMNQGSYHVNNEEMVTKKQFRFKDINASHWAYETIQKAYNFNMISNADYFFPNKIIQKAELISLIAKAPPIKEKLDGYFQ